MTKSPILWRSSSGFNFSLGYSNGERCKRCKSKCQARCWRILHARGFAERNAGRGLVWLRDRLGHASVNMTERYLRNVLNVDIGQMQTSAILPGRRTRRRGGSSARRGHPRSRRRTAPRKGRVSWADLVEVGPGRGRILVRALAIMANLPSS
jgi:hypothetical protein